jgi:hypothetical protein
MPNAHDGTPHYRFPAVETFLATVAACCSHPRLAHPFGRYDLTDIQSIVSPRYPLRLNQNPQNLVPPDLPYIAVTFKPNEERHVKDVLPTLPYPYYGCLPRKTAFQFRRLYPHYAPHLYAMSAATCQLLTMHAQKNTQPQVDEDSRIDWDDLLDPQSFREVFPYETPNRLLSRVKSKYQENPWTHRLPFILQCVRQISQLIRLFEAFFKAIGYEGLRDIVDTVNLNTDVDFTYCAILSIEEAIYLTALYDFLLREHALNLAQQVLRILHVSFENQAQLGLCRDIIIDAIDLPSYSYIIPDSDSYYW